jgi:predicted RNA-binding protein YlxR (DUF448 family)
MKNKRELLRVVRMEDGDTVLFSLDATGKKPGRGAYVCPHLACLEKSFKQKGLERSFKQAVPVEMYALLKSEMIRYGEQ